MNLSFMHHISPQEELQRLVTEEEGFEEDVLQIALGIRSVIRQSTISGVVQPVPLAVIQRDLMELIVMMRLKGIYAIFCPLRPPTNPPGWEVPDERLLRDWIQNAITEETWGHEVMYSVFGSHNVRLWEIPINGWRSILRMYLDQWVVRTPELLEEIQPFIEEERVDEAAGEYNASTFSGKSKNYN